jgi:putative colanic acid biosynthesis acetyltransferase WcaF
MIVSRSITMRSWCPNVLRVSMLRAFGAVIGSGVLVRHDVKIHWPWKLSIGAYSGVGEGVWILNFEPVSIGSNTCISQGVLLCTGSHDRRSATFDLDDAPIEIGDCVSVAARATVLRGVRIHDGATVGATALITGNVAADATVLAAPSCVNWPT